MLMLMYAANFSYYWHNYYQHYAKEFSGEWQWGYREAIQYIAPIKDKYKSIVMTESIGRPHMYVAFYQRLDPEVYRRTIDGSFDAAGLYNAYGLGKYRFVRQGVGTPEDKTLYILEPMYVPQHAHVLETIKLLNGKPILVIFDNI